MQEEAGSDLSMCRWRQVVTCPCAGGGRQWPVHVQEDAGSDLSMCRRRQAVTCPCAGGGRQWPVHVQEDAGSDLSMCRRRQVVTCSCAGGGVPTSWVRELVSDDHDRTFAASGDTHRSELQVGWNNYFSLFVDHFLSTVYISTDPVFSNLSIKKNKLLSSLCTVDKGHNYKFSPNGWVFQTLLWFKTTVKKSVK